MEPSLSLDGSSFGRRLGGKTCAWKHATRRAWARRRADVSIAAAVPRIYVAVLSLSYHSTSSSYNVSGENSGCWRAADAVSLPLKRLPSLAAFVARTLRGQSGATRFSAIWLSARVVEHRRYLRAACCSVGRGG